MYYSQPQPPVEEKKSSLTEYASNAWSTFTNMFSPNTTGGGKKQKKRKVGKSKGRTLRKGKSSGRKGKSRGRKSHSRKH
jgi:hypothetical protein